MTPLASRIAALIEAEGPIPLDRFWNLALFDAEDGYYASREPFGRTGDFVTAPEISQMFGELLAAWLVAAWRGLGAPSPFVLAEIGPGRATLMADLLRTVRQIDPAFLASARVTLVETSERLAVLQAERLAGFDLPIRHARRIEEAEALPLLLVANELFDAVAIRQFVFTGRRWRERRIGLAEDARLRFELADTDDRWATLLSRLPVSPEEGAVLEASPARAMIADAIARHLARHGGAALMIDYGHARTAFGDTLQAMRGHAFVDPLAEPGLSDITSHVDFAAIAARFRAAGLEVAPLAEQGAFLLDLGLASRAAVLGSGRAAAEQESVIAAVRRLAGSGEKEMGTLFKVLAAASAPLALPPFRAN